MTTTVLVQKNWRTPDLLRQTPGRSGVWDGIRFVMEPVDACDYLLILNMPEQPVTTVCPREHVWAIMQEPPNEVFRRMHRGRRQYHRVYTQHPRLTGRKYIHSQPAIAWHVDRDYDFLKDCPIPHKTAAASCITSAKTDFRGHVERLNFVQKLQKTVEFDLFGRGFREIADKWDGLAPYRYSIAIENFRNDWYWSEKIADCFLAWTMPIYYGCPRIAEYFPAESLVSIDIRDPDATRIVQETIRSDRWLRNIDAIAEARRLVLERHQLFSFVAQEIRRYEEGISGPPPKAVRVHVPNKLPFAVRVEERLLNQAVKVRRLLRGY